MSFKLDELQWSRPDIANDMQGVHDNSVLFYFMYSPYFDKTSNNNTVYNQALHNHDMYPILQFRERFEEFLRSMSGVEYIVHQAPAQTGAGAGTGVWVIRKQLRRKRNDGQPDDLTVYADYFVVGNNIYQAPTLADVLSSRITSMAVALGKAFPAMNSMQTWSPAEGHYYETAGKAAAKEAGEDGFVEGQTLEDDDDEDEDEDDSEDSEDSSDEDAMDIDKKEKTANDHGNNDNSSEYDSDDDAVLDPRLAEESYAIHMMYGGEYMDEQPISGRPGDFHIALAGGGRSAVGGAAGAAGAANGKGAAGAAADKTDDGKDGTGSGKATPKDGKESAKKSGATTPKPKRRKSKGPAAA